MESLLLISLGLAAVLFQCLAKLKGLLDDARAANINFNAKNDYWKRDAVVIIMAIIPVLIWYFIFGEVSAKYEWVLNLKRVSFVLVGGVGSWGLQYAFGTAKNVIRKAIDKKTNELNIEKGLPIDHKTDLPKQ